MGMLAKGTNRFQVTHKVSIGSGILGGGRGGGGLAVAGDDDDGT